MVSKTCKDCKGVLALEDFPIKKSNKDGHAARCFPCNRIKQADYQQTYVEKDPEKRRKQARMWARNHASEASVRARIYKYGIDAEELQDMLDQQDRSCGLCNRGFSNNELFVDHDHDCCPGQKTCGNCVRAILCRACNQGLGLLGDSPELLRAAADYIERYRFPGLIE